MRSVSRKRGPAKCEPPMTPMIDIIFNLLIFFLLTPSFQSDGYLTTNLPSELGPNPKEQTKVPRIKIDLFEEGAQGKEVSIVLNETQSLGSSFDLLRAELKRLQVKGLKQTHPVLVAPTMAVRYKWVVLAFDSAVAEEYKNIQFSVPHY